MRRCIAILAAVAALCVALPAAAQADYHIKRFDLSRSCVSPGDSVSATADVFQDSFQRQPLYARVEASPFGTGVPVYQKDEGPAYFPFGYWRLQSSVTVPSYAPPADYTVTLKAGATKGGSEWGTASKQLSVRPSGFC
jgi:hypothetical protein